MMDFQDAWEKALKKTEIVRPRVQPLLTFQVTQIPYVFLAESGVNAGDSIVRKGEIQVEKPSIIIPGNLPQFGGFQSGDAASFYEDMLSSFFLVRGIRFPSYKYNNQTHSLDVIEGGLQSAIDRYRRDLEMQENISTGLVIGPEDCWQFSVIIFVCSQMMKSADSDIQRLIDRYKNNPNA